MMNCIALHQDSHDTSRKSLHNLCKSQYKQVGNINQEKYFNTDKANVSIIKPSSSIYKTSETIPALRNDLKSFVQ